MKTRRGLIRILQVVVSAGLLGVAVWIAKPADLAAQARGANVGLLAASLLFVPFLILLRAGRWHMLARSRRKGMKFGRSFHSYMGGLTLAVVTPMSAGELARGAFAAPDDKAGFVGLTLVDKMVDATTLFVFACAGFMVAAPGGYRAIGAAGIAAAGAGWALARPLTGLAERRLPRSRLTGALGRAFEAAGGVGRGTIAACFVVAGVNFALYYCHLYVMMYSFAPEIRPAAVGLFPFITLSRIVPSISGIGVREFAAGALFADAQYSVTSAGAVAAAFGQFVTVNVLPALAWLVFSGGFRKFFPVTRETSDD